MATRASIIVAVALGVVVGLLAPAGAATRSSAPGAVHEPASPGRHAFTPLDRPARIDLGAGPGPAVGARPRTGANIVGGRSVRRGTHRWVGLVVLLDRDDRIIGTCTGTLIRQRFVLTAAHCLKGVRGAAVATRVTRMADLKPWHLTVANAKAVHPSYQPRTGRNDVGVLRLTERVRIPVVRLAGGRDATRAEPGTPAKILGWGAVDAAGTWSDRLLSGRVALWSNGACRDLFGSAWSGARMLCAGSATADACHGDSGGPLLVRHGERWFQHGVISFGDPECAVGDASVSTKVSAVRPWIERVTGLRPRG